MILIVSSHKDQSTNDVLRSIKRKDWLRINSADLCTELTLECSCGEWELFMKFSSANGEKAFKLSDLTAFWYRRGFININKNSNICVNSDVDSEIMRNLAVDIEKVEEFIYFLLRTKVKSLGDYFAEKRNNKIINLLLATQSGFKVPTSMVSNSKKSFLRFMEKPEGKFISKAINNPIFIKSEIYAVTSSKTELLRKNDIDNYDDNLPLSLCQTYVDKEIEVRIFFMKDIFFAMGILSQSNMKTSIDYRNYDREKPNRFVPFNIPPELKQKLLQFISLTKLDTGSIDLIVKKQTCEYIFLEVNPVGQFGFVSFHCNYNIEQEIANYLQS